MFCTGSLKSGAIVHIDTDNPFKYRGRYKREANALSLCVF